MKPIFYVVCFVFTFTIAMAAPSSAPSESRNQQCDSNPDLEMMRTVLSSEAAAEATAVAKTQGFDDFFRLEKTRTYRCPGCFEYTLYFRNPQTQEKALHLETALTPNNQVYVGFVGK